MMKTQKALNLFVLKVGHGFVERHSAKKPLQGALRPNRSPRDRAGPVDRGSGAAGLLGAIVSHTTRAAPRTDLVRREASRLALPMAHHSATAFLCHGALLNSLRSAQWGPAFETLPPMKR